MSTPPISGSARSREFGSCTGFPDIFVSRHERRCEQTEATRGLGDRESRAQRRLVPAEVTPSDQANAGPTYPPVTGCGTERAQAEAYWRLCMLEER